MGKSENKKNWAGKNLLNFIHKHTCSINSIIFGDEKIFFIKKFGPGVIEFSNKNIKTYF